MSPLHYQTPLCVFTSPWGTIKFLSHTQSHGCDGCSPRLIFSERLWNVSCSWLGEYGSVETTLNKQLKSSLCLSASLSLAFWLPNKYCNLWFSFFIVQVDSPRPGFLRIWWPFIEEQDIWTCWEKALIWLRAAFSRPQQLSVSIHWWAGLGLFTSEGGKGWFGGTDPEERGIGGRTGGQSSCSLLGILYWVGTLAVRVSGDQKRMQLFD